MKTEITATFHFLHHCYPNRFPRNLVKQCLPDDCFHVFVSIIGEQRPQTHYLIPVNYGCASMLHYRTQAFGIWLPGFILLMVVYEFCFFRYFQFPFFMEITLSIVLGLLGSVPLVIVLIKQRRVNKLRKTGIPVSAVVEDIIETRGYKGVSNFQVIVQYFVSGRGTMRSSFNFSYSGKQPLYRRMESVEIFYDKNKPERVITKKGNNYTVALVLSAIMAAAFLALSVALIRYLLNMGE